MLQEMKQLELQFPVWNDAVLEGKQRVVHAEKMFNARQHLAAASIAIHTNTPKEFLDKMYTRTRKLFKGAAKVDKAYKDVAEKDIESDADEVAKLALKKGAGASIEKIMNKAMQAAKKGAKLHDTLAYIKRKVEDEDWERLGEEHDGYTKEQYDASQVTKEEDGVLEGKYGQYAKNKALAALKAIDEGTTTDPEDHAEDGISREALKKEQAANVASIIQERMRVAKEGPLHQVLGHTTTQPLHDTFDLDTLTHKMHGKSGMTKEQFDTAMDVIQHRREREATPTKDMTAIDLATPQIRAEQSKFDKYKHQMEAVDENYADEQQLSRDRQLKVIKASIDKGMDYYAKTFSAEDDGSDMNNDINSNSADINMDLDSGVTDGISKSDPMLALP